MAGSESLEFPESEEELANLLEGVSLGSVPEIYVNGRHLHDITNETLPALVYYNRTPHIFVRAGSLVRINKDENDIYRVEPLSEAGLRGILSRCARYMVQCGRGRVEDADPPLKVVKDILSLPSWPDIPPLSCIIASPVVRADGSVITEPGYDTLTSMYYVGDLALQVPENPTKADAEAAAAYFLDEVFCDFPFMDSASKANALAALLTVIAKPLIDGNIPLGLIDKPQAGTGASLLTEIISEIATGASACMQTAPSSDEEWRKAITAVLVQAPQIVVVDNVTNMLKSAKLSQMLTARIWTDRLLGQSKMLYLPQTAAWFATGNNIALGGDIARRSYWIRLDAAAARPWLRRGFRHDDLKSWVREHRSELLTSLIILVRAWILAGRPDGDGLKIGSFEEWSAVIGGILCFAGIHDFLGNADQLYDSADQELAQWDLFLEQWQRLHGEDWITAAQLKTELTDFQVIYRPFQDEMPEEIIAATDKSKRGAVALGQTLRRHIDQVFPSGRKLAGTQDKHSKGMKWSIIDTSRLAEVEKTPKPLSRGGKAEVAEDVYNLKEIPDSKIVYSFNETPATPANKALDIENANLASSANKAPDSDLPSLEMVELRFLQPVRAFVGDTEDMRTFGPFLREDVATVPASQAKNLIRSGHAIEVHANIGPHPRRDAPAPIKLDEAAEAGV